MSTANMAFQRMVAAGSRSPRQVAIAAILIVALIAFEIFNFDTTKYALENLLGPVSFVGLGWATVLAIAFCGIDLAGLVRLFTPQQGEDEPREVWYLMGAWLLGATMNAVMTWWAVSLTLLNHDFGNEVLSRQQLLRYVPIFVAVLVWLTRILFIGSLTMAGEHILGQSGYRPAPAPRPSGNKAPKPGPARSPGNKVPRPAKASPARSYAARPAPAQPVQATPEIVEPAAPSAPPVRPKRETPANGRIRQRPPVPGNRPSSLNASGRYGR